MSKEQVKLVPSILTFKCMAGKDPGNHICFAKKIFVDARQTENRAVAAITWNPWNA